MTVEPKADQYFIPIDKNEVLPLPGSYTEAEADISASEMASFTLKPRKIRFLGTFLKLLGFALLLLTFREMIGFVEQMMLWHWSVGYLSAFLLAGLLVTLLLALRSYAINQKDLDSVNRFQQASQRLEHEKSFGQSRQFIRDLEQLYADKPQESLLKKALDTLPDYNNDVEVLQHLSEQFFTKLDKHALSIVSRHSQQTGLLVAISPLALADMLLSLWRMLKMIDEISQVYGIRPSLPGRVRLTKKLLAGMAMAGASELVTDSIADFSSASVAGVISARVGQGIGVGLYVARVGFRSMALCRPVPFSNENQPGINSVLPQLKHFISTKFGQGKSKSAES